MIGIRGHARETSKGADRVLSYMSLSLHTQNPHGHRPQSPPFVTESQLVAHTERGLGPAGASVWTFLDMAHIKPEPRLIVPGHPNELDPRLAIACPSDNPKIDAHGPVLVHVDAQLNGLPAFLDDRRL